jgi:hypothetical protein
MQAMYRKGLQAEGAFALREPVAAYRCDFEGEMTPLSTQNGVYWDVNVGASDA